MTRDVVVGLGANMGSRLTTLRCAVDVLASRDDVSVVASSRVYETEPVGPPQPRYLNAAARVRTPLSLRALLDRALEVEGLLGRERRERWGPRVVDLDLLFAGRERVDEPGLTVPHPHLTERPFALAPLLDVLLDPPEEITRALERLGGPPPVVAELSPPDLHARRARGRVEAEALAPTPLDALAAALTALGRELTAAGPLLRARVGWCGRQPDPDPILRVVVDAIADGFRPAWVTLTMLHDGLYARMIGSVGDPPRERPEPSRAALTESNGQSLAQLVVLAHPAGVESAK